jgi:hypothetical protein
MSWKPLFEISSDLKRSSSFQNRQWIWKTILHLKDMISGMLCQLLHGKALQTAFEKDGQKAPKIRRFASANVVIPEIVDLSQARLGSAGFSSWTFRKGSKALFSRLAILPNEIKGISVKTIPCHKQSFIAGIFFHSLTETVHLGYIGRECESIALERSSLVGLRISACKSGVCGICTISEKGVHTRIGTMGKLPKVQSFSVRGSKSL